MAAPRANRPAPLDSDRLGCQTRDVFSSRWRWRALIVIAAASSVVYGLPSAARAGIPRSAVQRIAAVYGNRFALLPTRVPATEIFLGWKVRRDANQPSYVSPTLTVSFARNGSTMWWIVSDGRVVDTTNTSACSAHPSASPYSGWIKTFGGRRYVYSAGNHTSSIGTCVRVSAHGSVFPLELLIAYENGDGAPTLSEQIAMLSSAKGQ